MLEEHEVNRLSWLLTRAGGNFGIIDAAPPSDIETLEMAELVKRVHPHLKRYKLTLKGWRLAKRLSERVSYGG